MSRYMDQGNKDMDVGVKAPMSGRGGEAILEEARGKTVGIVGDDGIAPGGLPARSKGRGLGKGASGLGKGKGLSR